MATIKAFKAVRPAADFAAKVAALPYDVMTSDEAREMVRGNPYSFLHVDKAEIDLDPGVDHYDDLVYVKARENLDRMISENVLIKDETPSLYIYRLTMDGRSQTGLVACTSVDEYMSGVIKKHENTRPDKETDRIRHVDACNANTGPIFLTYRANKDIDAIVEGVVSGSAPVYDFVAEDGVAHRAWAVSEPGVVAALQAAFARVPNLYIADGHHRNASAAKVALMRREANPGRDKDAEFNYYLSVMFPDDQLYIMDYNRVVKDLNGLTAEEFLAKVSEKFTVTKAEMGKPGKPHEFSMYLEGAWYALAAKLAYVPEDAVEGLDVSILQKLLLEPVLGIDDPRTNKRIDFIGGLRGLAELVKRVDSGEMKVAFALYPTSMRELFAVADAGKLMPPKSTWFEPKLRSGLFIHPLD